MRKIPDQPRAELVGPEHDQARLAILHYRVCRHESFGTWLEVRLETGRTHQIRVQCASRGHPVLGDRQYGATQAFGLPADDWRDACIGLHARRLGFEHPKSRERVIVTRAAAGAVARTAAAGGMGRAVCDLTSQRT